MAIAIPHKPRYRDRTLPIYYLVDDRMLLRRRPTQVHDPRTPAQLRQRLRLQVASRFLKGFRPMVAEGFAPEELDNLRRVGAYQQALSRLLRGALVETPEGVGIDAARVLLSEGYGAPLGAVRARAAGGTLRLAWEQGIPKGCGALWVGVWHRGLAQARRHRLEVAPGARRCRCRPTGRMGRWTCGWRPGARGRRSGTTPRTAWRPWARASPPRLPPQRARRSLVRRGVPRRYKQPPRLSPDSRWRVGWLTCRPGGGGNRPSSGYTTAACGWTSTPGRDGGEGAHQFPRRGWLRFGAQAVFVATWRAASRSPKTASRP